MDRLTALAAAVLALPEPPERVLEIGCGEGDATLFLAREFPAARVRGVDPSEAARVLRPGGHLIQVEPRRQGRWRLIVPWTQWRLATRGFEPALHEELAGRVVWIGRFAPP